MKFIALTILSVLVVVFVNPFTPFWIVMICIGMISALLGAKGFSSFLAGGLGMGLAWLGQTVFISYQTGSPLPDQMAEIMGLGSGVFLSMITGILGFLLGGFSAYSGSLFRRLFKKRPDNLYRG
ncbi:hypothetical protein FHS59_003373 [Algoriphagus iocasae]|uniref:Uncharacterized protein n=1 Tax=Algoriphagus iocasae TaxID=1836499 RepID=A0A841MJZ1_9BACT|nr:hypothetical protein [Algoriphagus iocasae]MBB6327730.1 hypothetical protein [Algoriphagus iocasae]